jgi:hypothetical protein
VLIVADDSNEELSFIASSHSAERIPASARVVTVRPGTGAISGNDGHGKDRRLFPRLRSTAGDPRPYLKH